MEIVKYDSEDINLPRFNMPSEDPIEEELLLEESKHDEEEIKVLEKELESEQRTVK